MSSQNEGNEVTITIRKYNNGKMYSKIHRKYLNKQEVFSLFKEHEIKIIQVETGEDITNIEIPKISNGLLVDVNDCKELFR